LVGWADNNALADLQVWVGGTQQPLVWLQRASGPCRTALLADFSAGRRGLPLEVTLVTSAGSLDYVELDPR
jgi:hypothetical protein